MKKKVIDNIFSVGANKTRINVYIKRERERERERRLPMLSFPV